jgi:hypothetical protein
MRINPIGIPPIYNNNSGFNAVRPALPPVLPRQNFAAARDTPSVTVMISPEARALSANTTLLSRFNAEQPPAQNFINVQEASGASNIAEFTGCVTCGERRYVDQSADGSVSFQMPTRISPEAAPAFVRAHENEHIANEQDRAEREERTVLNQSVIIHMDICEECGKAYVAGGEARTMTAPRNEQTALRAYQAMQNLLDFLF